jgi:streptogramin lyase
VLVGAVVIALVPAVAGIAVLAGRSPSSSPAARSHSQPITKQTLLSLPAASAAVRGDGGAWVTDDLRDRLLRFDPATGRTGTSVKLGGRPVAMVLAGADLWVANMVSNTVEEYVARTLRKIGSVAVPTGPSGLAVANGSLWVASVIENNVTPIDLRTGKVGTSLAVPAGAVRIAAGFGSLWVTGTSDQVTQIALSNVHGTGPVLPAITVGQGPIGVAIGDGSVWVANSAIGTVSRIDPKTRAVVHTYRLGGDPLTLAVSDGRLWIGDGTGQSLRTISSTGVVGKAESIGTTPRGLLPAGDGVWVVTANPGRVLAANAS